MADYNKNTGSAGVMLIRDLGYQIQFHLHSSDPQTFAGALPWSGYVNGQGVGGTVRYNSGSPWVIVATFDVGYAQDVRFSIGNTGTQGFGGPTDHWVRIERGQRPDAPSNVRVIVGHTDLVYQFAGNGDGGRPILRWEYQLWPTPDDNAPWAEAPMDGVVRRNDLGMGSTYWLRARGVNDKGTSDPSPWIKAVTYAGAMIKVEGVWRAAVPWIKVTGLWRQAIPYIKVNGVWRPAG